MKQGLMKREPPESPEELEPPSRPSPWLLQLPEPRRPLQLPSASDSRRKLEGGFELLEDALTHQAALEAALRHRKWRLHLHARRNSLRKLIRQEPALVEALDRVHHRAHVEGWGETEPALVLAREVERLRSRLGVHASQRLGHPRNHEPALVDQLGQLEQLLAQTVPPPLALDEKLLLEGGFSPSRSSVLFSSCLCLVLFNGFVSTETGDVPRDWVWVGLSGLALSALRVWDQRRCSGRYWLTQGRLIWQPTRGEPLQVLLHDLTPDSIRFRPPNRVEVTLADGRPLLLWFISDAERFVTRLKGHLASAPSRGMPDESEP
jgi:hypothetical protein